MFWFDFAFALLVAFVLTLIFAAGFRGQRGWSLLAGFFIIILLVTWAGGIWLTPLGYPLWGVNWIGFVVVGLIVALLITALLPPARPPRTRREAARQREAEAEVAAAFDAFFWILIIGLIIVVFFFYY